MSGNEANPIKLHGRVYALKIRTQSFGEVQIAEYRNVAQRKSGKPRDAGSIPAVPTKSNYGGNVWQADKITKNGGKIELTA